MVGQGRRVTLFATEPKKACGGNIAYLDGLVEQVETHLGPGNVRQAIEFFWNPKDSCPFDGEVGGCAFDNAAFSSTLPHDHEVIHALMPTRTIPFLEEGLAEAFGMPGNRKFVTQPRFLREPSTLIHAAHASELFDEGYLAAGAFVRFLIERRGAERFMKLYGSLPYEASVAEQSAAAAAAYGVPLEQLMGEFRAEAHVCTFIPRPCSQETVPWNGSLWQFDGAVSCASSTTMGPTGPNTDSPLDDDPEDIYWEEVALDVPAAGLYELQLSLDSNIKAGLVRCGSCDQQIPMHPFALMDTQRLFLQPGRYFFHVFSAKPDGGAYSIRITAVP